MCSLIGPNLAVVDTQWPDPYALLTLVALMGADVRTLKRTVRFTLLVTIHGNIPSIRGQVKSYGSSQLAVALLTGHRHK
jgi:hypothetical protein